MDAFTSCPLAFRFVNLDHLPEPPAAPSTKGSLVHRALELLYVNPPARRTAADARAAYDRAVAEYLVLPDLVDLHLDEAELDAFVADGWALVEAAMRMEDPTTVTPIGLELWMEATAGDVALRGISDRLELDADGELIVTDYKTGRPPGARYELRSLGAVQVYSLLCEEVLGRRPVAVRLMYLRDGVTITAHPSAQSVRFVRTKAAAIHAAIAEACATDRFEPRPGWLCASCAYQRWCPAFGGDPALAVIESGAESAAAAAAVAAA